jgi:hypothetical protein
MKTLILPDIHCHFAKAEAIISREVPDFTVFLGDYFDAYDETMEAHYQTAEWLRDSLKNTDRIHLLGNHDLSYLDPYYACSGFAQYKLFLIRKAGVPLKRLQLFHWLDENLLCTHAGLSNSFYQAYSNGLPIRKFLNKYSQKDLRDRLFNVSPHRGGRDAFGGIVWCDFDEFDHINGISQIFGHTRGDEPRIVMMEEDHYDYCIDTGLNNYIIYENDKIKLKHAKEGNPT